MAWDDQRVETLKTLWAEGKTAAEIAKAIGDVSRNAVIGKAHRLGLSNRAAGQKSAETEPEEPKELVKSSPKKKATSKAAVEENTPSTAAPEKSRSKAKPAAEKRGKTSRKAEDSAPEVEAKKGEQAAEPTAAATKSEEIEALEDALEFDDALESEDEEEGVNPIAALAAEAERNARKLSLLELNERTCKWPIGDPSTDDFYFCGLPCAPEKPYCAAHVQVAYQPMSSRRDRDRERSRTRAASA